jgi:hypothetical protein
VYNVVIFDCYEADGVRYAPLRAIFPLLDEERLGANSHIDFIESTLRIYDKTPMNVSFLVGDNAPVNVSVANQLNKPLIGCASHRFNLGFERFLVYGGLIQNIHGVMRKLHNTEKRAALRKRTDLGRILRNDTRWSSSY